MDLTQIYMTSPDWIKGLMVALPFLTIYATARLHYRRPVPIRPEPETVLMDIHRPETGRPAPLVLTSAVSGSEPEPATDLPVEADVRRDASP